MTHEVLATEGLLSSALNMEAAVSSEALLREQYILHRLKHVDTVGSAVKLPTLETAQGDCVYFVNRKAVCDKFVHTSRSQRKEDLQA